VTAYYNEIDPFAAAWLRNLIKAGAIAPGDVDERDIRDVNPDDLRGYTQCHFFAGIGVWSYALRLAGWADDRPVWTGSCPCQPFSAAGARGGVSDERHLWPHWHHLIRECRPASVFGEQVASKDGLGWLDLVSADLEGEGYAIGASDLCAAGVGAPHIRQRLFWRADRLADADRAGLSQRGGNRRLQRQAVGTHQGETDFGIGSAGGLADANGRDASAERQQRGGAHRQQPQNGGAVRGDDCRAWPDAGSGVERPGALGGHWRDADWLRCRDDRWRPVEPGTFPLADGIPARVGRLRAYGNAIVPQVAAAFIQMTEAACSTPR